MTGLCNIRPVAPVDVADVASAVCLPVIPQPVGGMTFLFSSGDLTDE